MKETPLQLNPSNNLIEEKINELEKSLRDAGRQSDTELITYYKDFIKFLRDYQINKFSYKYINEIASGDDELGEVGAAMFIKRYVPIKEGQLKIASIDTQKAIELILSDRNLYSLMMQTVIQHFDKLPNILENEFMDRFENLLDVDWNEISKTLLQKMNDFKKEGNLVWINSKIALINGKLAYAPSMIDSSDEYGNNTGNTPTELGDFNGSHFKTPYKNDPLKDYKPNTSIDNDKDFFPDESKDTTRDNVDEDGSQNSGVRGSNASLNDEYRTDKKFMDSKDNSLEIPVEDESENTAQTLKGANLTTDIKGEESEDSTDNVISSEEVNPVVTKYDKVSFVMRNTSDKYENLESFISKFALDNNINGVEEINIRLSKDNSNIVFKMSEIVTEIKNNRRIGMWINSKLMLDEEGNLKQADIKEAWNFDKKKDDKESDDKEEKKDEKKDDKECDCEEKDDKKKKWNFEKSSEVYSALESFVSRIAEEKGITDVSEISINFNKEAGVIEFKIAEDASSHEGKPENNAQLDLDNSNASTPEADSDTVESKQI